MGFKFRHKSKQILSPPRAGLQRGSHLAPFMCPNMGWDSRGAAFWRGVSGTLVPAAVSALSASPSMDVPSSFSCPES